MGKVVDLKVTQYELLDASPDWGSVRLEMRRASGDERWVITRSGECLGKSATWHGYYLFEIEPLPSSRGEDHYDEYYWPSAEEAYHFWLSNRQRIVATEAEWHALAQTMRPHVETV